LALAAQLGQRDDEQPAERPRAPARLLAPWRRRPLTLRPDLADPERDLEEPVLRARRRAAAARVVAPLLDLDLVDERELAPRLAERPAVDRRPFFELDEALRERDPRDCFDDFGISVGVSFR
jgi:hypothetical protein